VAQFAIEIILLRQWAAHMAVPIWITEASGKLAYYNEPAERLLGRTFAEAQQMQFEELSDLFHTTTVDGEPIPPEDLPLGIALREHRASHQRLRITALDQNPRVLEITAFPLTAQGGSHLGAVAMFWEAAE
jgi:PAS domain-containing protein